MKPLRKSWVLILLGIVFLPLLSYSGVSPSPGNEFSYHLFRVLSERYNAANFVFSPYAVRAALGMAGIGARGRTQKQLGKAPEIFNQRQEPLYPVLLANRLWIDLKIPIYESYMDTVETSFGARPWKVNFAKAPDFVSDRVNGWVEEKTSGKIQNLLSEESIASNSKMILSSAIYLKASWSYPFAKADTNPDHFSSISGNRDQVPFLHKTANLSSYINDDVQVLEVPYSNSDLSMLLILPNGSRSLSSIEMDLTADLVEAWTRGLTARQTRVSIPKFKIETALELADALKGIGIVDPFDANVADFSGMTNRALYLDRVVHKTLISVTEEGTEVGGWASASGRDIASQTGSLVPFKANHPFLFIVWNRSSKAPFIFGHYVGIVSKN